MAVDNQKVQEIIDHVAAIAKAQGGDEAKQAQFASWLLYCLRNENVLPVVPDRKAALDKYGVKPAYRALGVADLNLAAAEHYMLSKNWTANATYSLAQVKAMKLAYDAAKLLGLGGKMNHSSSPVTPVDPSVLKWALKGADNGDRVRIALGKPPAPLLKPIQETVNQTGAGFVPALNKYLAQAELFELLITGGSPTLRETLNKPYRGKP